MKKILLFTENLGSGGAERQLTGLAVLLKNAGYVVKVVTYIKAQHYESFLRKTEWIMNLEKILHLSSLEYGDY